MNFYPKGVGAYLRVLHKYFFPRLGILLRIFGPRARSFVYNTGDFVNNLKNAGDMSLFCQEISSPVGIFL
jgi:hypothetical protein